MFILILNALLLQVGGFGTSTMIMWVLILVIFYFFMIRPQSKRQKEQRVFMEGIAKGNEIVTASGMLGKISKIDGEIVTLEVAPKTFIRITKSAISKEMTQSIYAAMAKNTKAENLVVAKQEDTTPAEQG